MEPTIKKKLLTQSILQALVKFGLFKVFSIYE